MNRSIDISVIAIEKSDLISKRFEDSTNIQEEEYSERANNILERIQRESRRQDPPKDKRMKLCNHLKSSFQQKLWFSKTHRYRPMSQIMLKV